MLAPKPLELSLLLAGIDDLYILIYLSGMLPIFSLAFCIWIASSEECTGYLSVVDNDV